MKVIKPSTNIRPNARDWISVETFIPPAAGPTTIAENEVLVLVEWAPGQLQAEIGWRYEFGGVSEWRVRGSPSKAPVRKWMFIPRP